MNTALPLLRDIIAHVVCEYIPFAELGKLQKIVQGAHIRTSRRVVARHADETFRYVGEIIDDLMQSMEVRAIDSELESHPLNRDRYRYVDGKKYTESCMYYPDGKLMAKRCMVNDVLHGPEQIWTEDGTLHTTHYYKMGVRVKAERDKSTTD